MGQSAKNARRGGSRWSRTRPPPGGPDWQLDNITQTSIDINFNAALPSGMTRYGFRVKASATTAWGADQFYDFEPITQGLLTAGTSYDFQVFWGTAGTRLSEYSDQKSATTLP